MVLESICDGTGVHAVIELKTSCDAIPIKYLMQFCCVVSQSILITHIHRNGAQTTG